VFHFFKLIKKPDKKLNLPGFIIKPDLNGAPLEVTNERGAVRRSGQYGSFSEMRHQS